MSLISQTNGPAKDTYYWGSAGAGSVQYYTGPSSVDTITPIKATAQITLSSIVVDTTKTYSVSCNLLITSSNAIINDDAFQYTLGNSSGGSTTGFFTGLVPVGLYNLSAGFPVGISQTLTGMIKNPGGTALTLAVGLTANATTYTYSLSVRNVIVQQLT